MGHGGETTMLTHFISPSTPTGLRGEVGHNIGSDVLQVPLSQPFTVEDLRVNTTTSEIQT